MLLSPDLTHADWWIRTCTKLLQKVDTSLRFTVVKVEKTQHLMVENISETTLSKLFFLVNTDQNNNYGYLEALQVFVKGDYSRTAIPIPGFSTLANAIWNEVDATGFVEGQKTQTAFLAPLNNPYTNEPLTVPEYVDWITAVIPWAPKTFGKEKIFTLMLNPDSAEALVGEDVARGVGKQFLKGGGEEKGAMTFGDPAFKHVERDIDAEFFNAAKELILKIGLPSIALGSGIYGLSKVINI
jgi:hypothetical protein